MKTQKYRIPEQNLSELRARIEKLSKRAAKLALEPITLSVSEEVEEERKKDADTGLPTRVIRWHKVTVSGGVPRLAGWTFVAALQHLEEGNVIRAVPGEEVPAAYRTAASECEHCQVKRRRHDTFLVRDDAGTYKQVGRNCLADFTGCEDPHAVATYAELLSAAAEACGGAEDEGWGGGGGGKINFIDLHTYLSYVAAAIRQAGWVSRKEANQKAVTATADFAFESMFPNPTSDKKHLAAPEERDATLAREAIDWIEALQPQPGNDYEWNLKLSCGSGSGTLPIRCAGIAASLISTYERWLGNEVKRRQRAATSAHFGTVGKREVFALTVTGTNAMDGNYGVTTLVSFVDPSGNVAKWFASGYQEVKIGKTYQIKATVKKHDEFKGVKQTMLTRCKIMAEVTEAEMPAPEATGTAKNDKKAYALGRV